MGPPPTSLQQRPPPSQLQPLPQHSMGSWVGMGTQITALNWDEDVDEVQAPDGILSPAFLGTSTQTSQHPSPHGPAESTLAMQQFALQPPSASVTAAHPHGTVARPA